MTAVNRNHKPARTARDDAGAFYAELLHLLKRTRIGFMVGGTCAINAYIGLRRPTKDLDIFCRAGDYPRLLGAAAREGFRTEVEDERWIAKVRRGRFYCDVIFGSANLVAPVSDEWFRDTPPARVLGVGVRLLGVTEMIWSKIFIMDRYKYDGNDIAHLILRKHAQIDWKRLLSYMEPHWEVLLMNLVRFRYIYPSAREIVPAWLLDELLSRLAEQRRAPTPRMKTCRGRIFSREDFVIDITEWGFADLVGGETPE